MSDNETPWTSYYAARAKAFRAQAEAHRLYGEAERISPLGSDKSDFYANLAADYDRQAAEIEEEDAA